MATGTEIAIEDGDYLAPAFEHARVSDVMRTGVFACAASTPLIGVARIMATNHVHSVAVTGIDLGGEGESVRRTWGIVSDLDLVRAAREGGDVMAGVVADVDPPIAHPNMPLTEAADLMAQRGVTHLIVEDPEGGQPLGVVSGLDVAGNLAWARG